MRYFFGFLAASVVVIFLIVILASGGSSNGGSKIKSINLVDFSQDSSDISMFVDGPINALELHRQIKITISQDSRQLDIFEGYDGQKLSSISLSNTSNSYDDFLHALSVSGFTKAKNLNQNKTEQGYCPLGFRTVYELRNNQEQKLRLWTTTCNNVPATFAGQKTTIESLFKNQIPDYSKLTSTLQF